MKTFYSTCRVVAILCMLSFAGVSTAQTTIFKHNLNNLPKRKIGSQSEAKRLLRAFYVKGADEGRLFGVTDRSGKGKCLKVLYPKGKVKTGDSGVEAKMWLESSKKMHKKLELSYYVKFHKGTDFVKGGKLPGLGGREGKMNQTLRLMWRDKGKLEFYIHTNTKEKNTRLWWNNTGKGQAKLKPNKWYHIRVRFTMNDYGKSNGRMEGWLNGVKYADYKKRKDFVQKPKEKGFGLNHVHLSSFYGGSAHKDVKKDFRPKKNEYAYFDDFVVKRFDRKSAGDDGVIFTDDLNENGINVYPNPAQDYFTIMLNGMEKAKISIYSLSGKLVYKTQTDEPHLTIERPSGLVPGIYIISANGENGAVVTKKLSVQ